MLPEFHLLEVSSRREARLSQMLHGQCRCINRLMYSINSLLHESCSKQDSSTPESGAVAFSHHPKMFNWGAPVAYSPRDVYWAISPSVIRMPFRGGCRRLLGASACLWARRWTFHITTSGTAPGPDHQMEPACGREAGSSSIFIRHALPDQDLSTPQLSSYLYASSPSL